MCTATYALAAIQTGDFKWGPETSDMTKAELVHIEGMEA
jgi:hypothetical protein